MGSADVWHWQPLLGDVSISQNYRGPGNTGTGETSCTEVHIISSEPQGPHRHMLLKLQQIMTSSDATCRLHHGSLLTRSYRVQLQMAWEPHTHTHRKSLKSKHIKTLKHTDRQQNGRSNRNKLSVFWLVWKIRFSHWWVHGEVSPQRAVVLTEGNEGVGFRVVVSKETLVSVVQHSWPLESGRQTECSCWVCVSWAFVCFRA